jgi:hypothetical protein
MFADRWQNWFGPAPLDTGAQLSQIALEYSTDELARATSGYNQSCQLGAGNYGAVYKGVMRDGSEVAIKLMEIDECEGVDSGFADEVKCLSKFRHPNLVTLMGWAKAPGQRFIVYELLQGGDVSKRLKGVVRGEPFDWKERLNIARDAASGLSHMHNSTPKAFHRDIKSANILLDRNGTAKMADFGLSLINQCQKGKPRGGKAMTVENISGTPGYACPHYIKTGRIAEQTEVFAYGMVTLEMMLNTAPACMGQNGTILYPIFQTIMPQVAGGLERTLAALDPAAQWPPELGKELAELALTCISIEEARRPDFIRVLQHVRPMCERYGSRTPRRGRPGEAPPSQAAHASLVAAGYPGVPQGGSAADPPTRPQLGLPGAVGAGGGAGDMVTQPQLGLPGGQVTNPQMHGGPVTNPQMVGSPVTNPQMQGGPVTNPQIQGPLEVIRAAAPKAKAGATSSRNPQAPGDHINLASDPFLMKAPTRELVEVVLECTYSAGVDIASIPPKHKCLTLKVGENGPPWAVGRQMQPQFFARLVPDEALRSHISRNHLELSWEAPNLMLKKLSQNAISINGTPAPQQAIQLPQGVQLSFHPATPEKAPPPPFMAFAVQMRDSATIAACGPTPLPTKPDVAIPDHVVKQLQQQHEQQQQMQNQMVPPASQQRPQTCPAAAQHAQLPPTQVRAGVPQASAQASQRFVLFCSSVAAASGGDRDLTSLSLEQRTIQLPADGRLSVGRAHQHGFFEALLGADSIFLTFISRLHFEVMPASTKARAYEITNNSANPLVVGEEQIQKGACGLLRPKCSIDFISKSAGGAKPQVFLRLEVLDEAQSQSAAREPHRPVAHPSTPHMGADQSAMPSYGLAEPSTSPHHSTPQPPVSACRMGLEKMGLSSPLTAKAATTTPPTQLDAGGAGESPFWLELGGTALKTEFLAAARSRRLQGSEAGLTVGRCHQSNLLSEAVRDGVMQYLSREHFKIERAEAGHYILMPLSANPMWRVRNGERTSAVKGCSMFLEPGDAILLFTGAPDCTPDGPGSKGTLFFRFGDAWLSHAKLNSDPLASVTGPPAPSAWAPATSCQAPGTGVFDADGRPMAAGATHQQASTPGMPSQQAIPRGGYDHPSSQQATANNALAPPMGVMPTILSEDELMAANLGSPMAANLGSLDLDGSKRQHDAFAKSGFSYGR